VAELAASTYFDFSAAHAAAEGIRVLAAPSAKRPLRARSAA